ncbi:MAG: hypothetical protein ACLPX5_00650 [Dissulfurispiraceae bacterium]
MQQVFTLLLKFLWISFSGMVGGGVLGVVIGTVHITTIVDGDTIEVECQHFTAV